jgi:ubiquinone/menaquinone biosynthesis C-methylase UbiE
MSATMDWVGQDRRRPPLYELFMVPAIFGPFAEDLADFAGVADGMRVLDVACGTGAASRASARRAGRTGSVTGVDIAPEMVAVALAQPADGGAAPIEYAVAPADDPRVPEGSFDLVTCQQGLQFFQDRPAALRAMRTALRPGGHIAIATWTDHDAAIGSRALADAIALHVDPEAAEVMRSPWGLSDADELATLVSAAGFEQVEVLQHTRPVRFPMRREFARNMASAVPLAQAFSTASPDQQQAVLSYVTDAVSGCAGGAEEVRYRMTTNIALAVRH